VRSAEHESAQLWVEVRASKSPIHNQKLGHLAFSCSSHTRREKFATGPEQHVKVLAEAEATDGEEIGSLAERMADVLAECVGIIHRVQDRPPGR
jgi:hypothetical protein